MSIRTARTFVAVTALLALVTGLTVAAQASGRVRLADSGVRWATSANLVGRAGSAGSVRFQVYLGLRDAAAAERLASQVADPQSRSYGHFLSPSRFRARFSPSADAVARVRSWLSAEGFTVTSVPENRTSVEASGTVAQAERAFSVELNEYRVGDAVLRGTNTAPAIPEDLGGVVDGIGGLNESVRQTASGAEARPAPPSIAAHPCSNFWGEETAQNKPKAYGHTLPFAPCGYSPRQMQGAYGVENPIANGNDGGGTTVAILDAFRSPTLLQDLRTYSSRNGLPSPSYSEILQSCPCPGTRADKQGWYGEQTLDVEAVHSMAPGAHILYVGTRSTNDIDFIRMTTRIVDDGRADVISNSTGDLGETIPQSEIRAQHESFVQAAAEGMSVLFSSGDSGDEVEALGYRSVDWPESDPLVTSVGGTSLGVGPLRNYLFETGWGTRTSTLVHHDWSPQPPGDFLYGGGGGTSRIFDEPAYQRGVVPRGYAHAWGGSNRVVPDIAADGDPSTGFLFGERYTYPSGAVKYAESRIGGTSLSCPLMAGVTALAVQKGHDRLGLLNPALYQHVRSSAFRDIVDPPRTIALVRTNYVNGYSPAAGRYYQLRTLNQTGTIHTRQGYDNVTGLGSPRGQQLINALTG